MSILETRGTSNRQAALKGLLALVALWAAGHLATWALTSGAGEPADDLELVRQAQRGNLSAFNVLVGRYQRLAYNVAYRVTGDPDLAADATQEAFLSAYRALHTFDGGSFKAWLLRIVTNKCYDILRYHRRRPAASLEALLVDAHNPDAPLKREAPERPDEVLERLELAEVLQAAIMKLPEDQRVTLVLADVHGFSYEEIARITGVQLGTVKSRLNRARRKLRDILWQNQELLPPEYRLKRDA